MLRAHGWYPYCKTWMFDKQGLKLIEEVILQLQSFLIGLVVLSVDKFGITMDIKL